MASPATVDTVVASVRNFYLRRDFNEGRSFILSLEESVTRLVEVGLVSAGFYMVSGHPKWAEESLEIANCEVLISEDCALLQEEIAFMALIAAHVKIRRYCQYKKSHALIREIEDLYVNLQRGSQPSTNFINYLLIDFSSASTCPHPSHAAHFDRIKRQSQLWKIDKPEDFDDTETPISDIRVSLPDIFVLVIY